MGESDSLTKRWRATLITLPLSVILVFIGALTTGAGHGTAMVVKLFYTPVLLLPPLPGGFVMGVLLSCGIHVGYALLADTCKYYRWGGVIFAALLLIHYGLFFFYAQDPDERALFAKSYAIDSGFLIFAIALFVIWQMALLRMVIFHKRYFLSGRCV